MPYIAESRAAYGLITDYPHHPTTDEGWAMAAAARTVDSGDSETGVRHSLAMHLIHNMAGLPGKEQKVYRGAANAIVDGVDAVQISGRVYRIRKV